MPDGPAKTTLSQTLRESSDALAKYVQRILKAMKEGEEKKLAAVADEMRKDELLQAGEADIKEYKKRAREALFYYRLRP